MPPTTIGYACSTFPTSTRCLKVPVPPPPPDSKSCMNPSFLYFVLFCFKLVFLFLSRFQCYLLMLLFFRFECIKISSALLLYIHCGWQFTIYSLSRGFIAGVFVCWFLCSPVYNRFKVAEGDENLFSMRGRKDAEKRMKIYKFLLSHLTDEHRFQLTSKLCQVSY